MTEGGAVEAERRDTDGGPNGYYWKPRAEEAEAKIARLQGALRTMLDATDAHRTDGKNTPKHLEAARTQASAVLAKNNPAAADVDLKDDATR